MDDIPDMPASLRATHPHLERFWEFLQRLHRESERGRVLISAGLLEEQLKQILLAFMLETQASKALLQGATAPLGTFHSRIEAAYALALISEEQYHDLCLIRRIRNDFAHNLQASFTSPGIRDRCNQLRMKADGYGDVKIPSGDQFQTSATALILHLTNRPHHVAKQRRQIQAWPY
jgi:DNA-binding MltR family transcriptional regulator